MCTVIIYDQHGQVLGTLKLSKKDCARLCPGEYLEERLCAAFGLPLLANCLIKNFESMSGEADNTALFYKLVVER